jgi:1-acyl-sn-glycerol-3-phosphate acyltransferase
MLFLRSLLYNIGATIVLIIVVMLLLCTFFLPFQFRYAIGSKWAKFCIWWLQVTCNIDIKIKGLEHIPNHTCVVASNHQSTLDTLFFQTFLPPQTWVLKKQLLYIPIFGWGLALLKPIVIDRGDKMGAIRKVIKQGLHRIKEGIWVIIYPEGTRQPYGKIAKYQSGAVAIAQQSGVTILPIYHNAGQVWEKGKFTKKPGTILITIGKEINPAGKKAKAVIQDIEQWAAHLQESYINSAK